MSERILLSLKYGRAYPADYVNVLHSACRKAMKGAFRFVCLTDDPAGLNEGIEALPIPDVGLDPKEWFVGGVWPKLGIYDRLLHGLKGRCLFIDLDMVVLRDLDAFFDRPGRYIGIDAGEAWGRPGRAASAELCSAMIAFDAGGLPQLAETFRTEKTRIMGSYRTEQAYTEDMLAPIGYWPEGWVISFKRRLRQPIGLDLFLEPKEPPPAAKVLAFHGRPRPMALIDGKQLFWDRFPHLGHGRVSWLTRYWVDNGGRLP